MSNQDLTRLLLSHGDIQVSPQEVQLLNGEPLTKYFDPRTSSRPSDGGYAVILSGYCRFILEKERASLTSGPLETLLNGLRSMPRSPKAKKLRNSVTTYKIENDQFSVMYQINSGQITVFNTQPKDALQKARDRSERTSVYHVKKDQNGIWRSSDRGIKGSVSTKYAAVNGQSNNLNKAVWLMGEHLKVAYGNVEEYTLFHNPSVGGGGDTWESIQDKFGLTTQVTKAFADTLERAQSKGAETYWVAHSQGGLIFAEGTRYLLNHKSEWALNNLSLNGIRHPDKGRLLDQQYVAFHGNANNNFRSKKLFERAGVTITGIKAHDYDFVTNIIGLNSVNPRKVAGSLIYANHVFSGSIPQSPHTTVQSRESWDKNMIEGPGKGRGVIQKAFNQAESSGKFIVKRISNFLK